MAAMNLAYHDKAEAAFTRARNLDSSGVLACQGLEQLYEKMGEPDKLCEVLGDLVGITSGTKRARPFLARFAKALGAAGKYADAVAAWREVLALDAQGGGKGPFKKRMLPHAQICGLLMRTEAAQLEEAEEKGEGKGKGGLPQVAAAASADTAAELDGAVRELVRAVERWVGDVGEAGAAGDEGGQMRHVLRSWSELLVERQCFRSVLVSACPPGGGDDAFRGSAAAAVAQVVDVCVAMAAAADRCGVAVPVAVQEAAVALAPEHTATSSLTAETVAGWGTALLASGAGAGSGSGSRSCSEVSSTATLWCLGRALDEGGALPADIAARLLRGNNIEGFIRPHAGSARLAFAAGQILLHSKEGSPGTLEGAVAASHCAAVALKAADGVQLYRRVAAARRPATPDSEESLGAEGGGESKAVGGGSTAVGGVAAVAKESNTASGGAATAAAAAVSGVSADTRALLPPWFTYGTWSFSTMLGVVSPGIMQQRARLLRGQAEARGHRGDMSRGTLQGLLEAAAAGGDGDSSASSIDTSGRTRVLCHTALVELVEVEMTAGAAGNVASWGAAARHISAASTLLPAAEEMGGGRQTALRRCLHDCQRTWAQYACAGSESKDDGGSGESKNTNDGDGGAPIDAATVIQRLTESLAAWSALESTDAAVHAAVDAAAAPPGGDTLGGAPWQSWLSLDLDTACLRRMRAVYHCRLGGVKWHSSQGADKTCQRDFLVAAKTDPSCPLAFGWLGTMYQQLYQDANQAAGEAGGAAGGGQKEALRAQKCFEKAVAIDPFRDLSLASPCTEALFGLYSRGGGQRSKAQAMLAEATRRGKAAGVPLRALVPMWLCDGRQASADGDEQQGAECYQRALRACPQDVRLWSALGNCYRRQGKFAAALKVFTRTLELDPASPKHLCDIGDVECTVQLHEEAQEHLEAALKARPAYLPALFALGKTTLAWARKLSSIGQYGNAARLVARGVQCARAATKLRPDTVCLWKLLGDLCAVAAHLSSHAFVKPVDAAAAAAKAKGGGEGGVGGGEASAAAALERTERGHARQEQLLKLGRSAFAKAIRANPTMAESWYDLGLCTYLTCQTKGRFAQNGLVGGVKGAGGGVTGGAQVAGGGVAAGQRLPPGFGGGDAATAGGEGKDKSVDDDDDGERERQLALGTFKAAILIDPRNAYFWNGFGVAESDARPLSRQHAFVKAIQLDNIPSAWSNLGMLYLQYGKVELAKTAFMTSQSLNSASSIMWVGHGMIAERLLAAGGDDGDTSGGGGGGGRGDSYGSTSSSSSYDSALHQRGKYMRNALAAFGCAMDFYPVMEAMLGCGYAMFAAGKASEAVSSLRQYLSKDPSHCGALNVLGLALERLGRHGEADQAFSFAWRLLTKALRREVGAVGGAGGVGGEGAEALRMQVAAVGSNLARCRCSVGEVSSVQSILDTLDDLGCRSAGDSDPSLQLSAARALGMSGNIRAADALLGRLIDTLSGTIFALGATAAEAGDDRRLEEKHSMRGTSKMSEDGVAWSSRKVSHTAQHGMLCRLLLSAATLRCKLAVSDAGGAGGFLGGGGAGGAQASSLLLDTIKGMREEPLLGSSAWGAVAVLGHTSSNEALLRHAESASLSSSGCRSSSGDGGSGGDGGGSSSVEGAGGKAPPPGFGGGFEEAASSSSLEEGGTWTCAACTMINQPQAQWCEVCETAKPNSADAANDVNDGDNGAASATAAAAVEKAQQDAREAEEKKNREEEAGGGQRDSLETTLLHLRIACAAGDIGKARVILCGFLRQIEAKENGRAGRGGRMGGSRPEDMDAGEAAAEEGAKTEAWMHLSMLYSLQLYGVGARTDQARPGQRRFLDADGGEERQGEGGGEEEGEVSTLLAVQCAQEALRESMVDHSRALCTLAAAALSRPEAVVSAEGAGDDAGEDGVGEEDGQETKEGKGSAVEGGEEEWEGEGGDGIEGKTSKKSKEGKKGKVNKGASAVQGGNGVNDEDAMGRMDPRTAAQRAVHSDPTQFMCWKALSFTRARRGDYGGAARLLKGGM
jgi:tetratricopeptide (TPR) repeat protein